MFKYCGEIAHQSTCRRRQVGAALLNPMDGLVSIGWNREMDQLDCESDCPRYKNGVPPASGYEGDGRCIATHAEMMAIDHAYTVGSDQLSGFKMFVNYRPCSDCQAVLDELGIIVHWDKEYK